MGLCVRVGGRAGLGSRMGGFYVVRLLVRWASVFRVVGSLGCVFRG